MVPNNNKKDLLQLVFKDEVPVFYQEDHKNEENNNKFVHIPIKAHQTNNIRVSFQKEICQQHSIEALTIGQVSAELKSLGLKKQLTHLQNLEKLKQYFESSSSPSIYGSVKTANKYVKEVALPFLKELECFVNVKFDLLNDAQSLSSDVYTISICSMPDNFMKQYFQQEAYTQFCSYDSNQNNHAAQIILDGEVRPDVMTYSPEGTIKHEILHTLGLGHPHYTILSNNLRYRSIVEDTNNIKELPLSAYCVRKSKTLHEQLECGKAPINLTPVDVKGLISLWGWSNDQSEFCQTMRSEFVDNYRDYLQEESISFHQEF